MWNWKEDLRRRGNENGAEKERAQPTSGESVQSSTCHHISEAIALWCVVNEST